MRLSWAARTDPGLRRAHNEDCHSAQPELGLFVVADGVGGHAGGSTASRLAVDAIVDAVETTAPLGPADGWPGSFDPALSRAGNRLRAGFDLANRQIAERAAAAAELRDMATTAVALLVDGLTAALAHAGDSRAYLHRPAGLTRLTRDHSWVEEQVRAGTLSAAAAREHPWRNIVTRVLAAGEGAAPEITELTLRPGDRLLLCTDGLSAVLPTDTIGGVLSDHEDLQAACDAFVRLANARGGPDNITAILVQIDAG